MILRPEHDAGEYVEQTGVDVEDANTVALMSGLGDLSGRLAVGTRPHRGLIRVVRRSFPIGIRVQNHNHDTM